MAAPPTIQYASLGMADSLILMVLALVVFGPRRLPQIGRQLGKLMFEFRKASNDFKYQMEEELRAAEETDRRKKEEQRLSALPAPLPAQPALTAETAVTAPSDSAATTDSPNLSDGPSPSAARTDGTFPEPRFAEPNPPEPQSPETKQEEPFPRIQPPSTGEQVPAAKLWSLEEEPAIISSPAANSMVGDLLAESPSDKSTPPPEPAHHG